MAQQPQPAAERTVTLFLGGDVMTGRAIDQAFERSCDPRLREPYVSSAREYLLLAEAAHGPIPCPARPDYVWGDLLAEFTQRAPDARLVNLETAITENEGAASKPVHYRMHPENVAVLSAARIDVCALANNHVLDWRRKGLLDTLDALKAAGIGAAGAGRDAAAAAQPAVVPLPGGGRLLVFALASATAGVPEDWAATDTRAGVALFTRTGSPLLRMLAERVRAVRLPGDIVVFSIHWGPNWSYGVPRWQAELAHRLIEDAGADVIHGHSSHHRKAIEIHRGRAILYGCGDLMNDYEGIGGHDRFRPELVLGYFLTLRPDGALAALDMVPFRLRNFRLHRAAAEEAAWLADTMEAEVGAFGAEVVPDSAGTLSLHWDDRG